MFASYLLPNNNSHYVDLFVNNTIQITQKLQNHLEILVTWFKKCKIYVYFSKLIQIIFTLRSIKFSPTYIDNI
ncbi:RNA-directed DNA polymerase from mobile element jockey [Aphis craccivora]|uniref:RNA-directed DNA polymerase from mobile element jockey n=1 Tax=Aphis craccivora TaxID=307492 RepID=A0A6G0ZEU0_APHCR|nr:RNA-directed DNA polymerase from mobile element jockey [Aphis craccivora]